jgi:hypothetical protein
MIIKPSIGRIVWYWPRSLDGYKADQALAAIITLVHSDHVVNLVAFSPTGVSIPRINVYLAQDSVDHPYQSNYAQWMPYQVGQAKQATREAFATQLGLGA